MSSRFMRLYLMPDPVARAPDLRPGLIRAERRSLIPETDGSFADDQKLPFDRGDRLRVGAEYLKIHTSYELFDAGDRVENVPKGLRRVSKRTRIASRSAFSRMGA